MRTFTQANSDSILRLKSYVQRIDGPLAPIDRVDTISLTPPLPNRFRSNALDPSIVSIAKREQDAINEAVEYAFKLNDYGAVYDTLDFLKFSRYNAEAIVSVVSTAAGFISGVGAIISAVQTASKVLEYLGITSSNNFDLEATLITIGEEVNAIYKHLINEAQQEQLDQAAEIRGSVSRLKSTVDSVRATGLSVQSVQDLSAAIDRIDKVIHTMLAPSSGNIPFSDASYKHPIGAPNWPHYLGTPYLKFADGSPTSKLTPLASQVWDPGHYIDALATALRLRVAAGATLEPLFRSTGHRRPALEEMVPKLRIFIDHWRNSFWVAQPGECILADGTITIYQHDRWNMGLLIGAICPATGISSLRIFNDFVRKHTTKQTVPFGGPATKTVKADDPQRALYDAMVQHQIALRWLHAACGLNEFERLYRELKDLAGPPQPTEAVHFGKRQTYSDAF